MGFDGMEVIAEIRQIYDNYDFDTEILAASIRSADHGSSAGALIGAYVANRAAGNTQGAGQAPADRQGGLEAFLSDWAKTGQKNG